jgi:hypothetical protein
MAGARKGNAGRNPGMFKSELCFSLENGALIENAATYCRIRQRNRVARLFSHARMQKMSATIMTARGGRASN